MAASSGSSTEATRTTCSRDSALTVSSSPESTADTSTVVRITTSARWLSRPWTRRATAGQSGSMSAGWTVARASASAGIIAGPVMPATRARSERSNAVTCTRSPARAASALSKSVASMPASSRGASPTRAADRRDVSSTVSTRRSRSGRYVRTSTSPRRADARQSSERTSSPITYSRSESNSAPAPFSWTALWPSISRSRARRDGR